MNPPYTADRRSFLKLSATLAAMGVASAAIAPWASAQQPAAGNLIDNYRALGAKTPLKTTPLAKGLMLLQGVGGNMVAMTGTEGKVLIDSSVSTAAPHIREALAAMDAQPLKYLVNTHWHFDHTDGNEPVHAMGATIVAHENTWKRLSTPQYIEVTDLHFPAAPAAALPTRTLTDGFTFFVNGDEMKLQHFAPAHTDSDIYVHFRQGDVLHVGDIWFNGFYPLIDYSSGGSANGMVEAAALALRTAGTDTKIVPGHGPLGNRAALTEYHDMLATVRDRVGKLKQSGKSAEETVAAKPTQQFDAQWGKGTLTPDKFVMIVYKSL